MKLKPTIRVGALAGVSLCLLAASPSVKESMKSVVEPTSNVLFAVGGEVDPANGPDAAKVSDARWQEAALAAGKLKLAAVALLQPDQAKPGADWTMSAKQLGDLADTAEKAAKREGRRQVGRRCLMRLATTAPPATANTSRRPAADPHAPLTLRRPQKPAAQRF